MVYSPIFIVACLHVDDRFSGVLCQSSTFASMKANRIIRAFLSLSAMFKGK